VAWTSRPDERRAARVAARRRLAGFVEEEVEEFQEIFDRYDRDGSGDIDSKELRSLLRDLGMECRTRAEQRALMGQLDAAQTAAREAGAVPVGRQGDGGVGFWVLVQLMRILRSRKDESTEAHEAEVVGELGFSPAEVTEFREVFLDWTRRGGLRAKETDVDGAVGSIPGRRVSFNLGSEDQEDRLSKHGFHRLLRSLGVSISQREKKELEEKLADVDMDDRGCLSFLGFLRMMRWLLDSDFAGVNRAAARTVESNARGHFKSVLA